MEMSAISASEWEFKIMLDELRRALLYEDYEHKWEEIELRNDLDLRVKEAFFNAIFRLEISTLSLVNRASLQIRASRMTNQVIRANFQMRLIKEELRKNILDEEWAMNCFSEGTKESEHVNIFIRAHRVFKEQVKEAEDAVHQKVILQLKELLEQEKFDDAMGLYNSYTLLSQVREKTELFIQRELEMKSMLGIGVAIDVQL